MSDFLGKTIADYQIIEPLDEGGTAMVYKAFQPAMNRYVALKVLKPSAARDPVAVQQFLQQAQLMARVQHPNVLTVYSSGQEGEVVYRAERLAESGSLRDHLNWFYDPSQAFGLVDKLTGGLEAIYAQGYVHGNLKPNNILLDASQEPLLGDFGFPPKPTQPPSPYLAPEQIQGGVVDGRTDVYALGVLVVEMLTVQAPPPGAVVSPRSQRPDLPEALERMILKAMAQNPDQRYQDAREFRNAMQAAVQTPTPQPVYQTPPPAPAPTPAVSQSVTVEGQKSGPNWLAIVLGVILVGIICVGGFFGLQYIMGNDGTETEQPPPGETIIVPTDAPPTQEIPPTQPPEQPTQPPEIPTEEPPVEEPPTEGPPEQEPPPAEQLPAEPGEPPGAGLPDVCGSVGAVGVGIGLVSLTAFKKRRSRR